MKDCFFCDPDKDRLLYESEYFYVFLGLGPIVEGYTLLVAKQHIRSMLDMPCEMRAAYEAEKGHLKELIHAAYGSPTIVTEHGRVQVCIVEDEEAHDLLCYHAHQLFFPVDVDLSRLSHEGPFEKVFEGGSLFEMPASQLQEDEEYLLFEKSSGRVFVYKVAGKCPRQYMRYLVARSLGRPELANWQRYPEWEKIWAAREQYYQCLSSLSSRSRPIV
ncbi:MAG: HIT domain-containing protein [Ktedonobacteraceae bacterium]